MGGGKKTRVTCVIMWDGKLSSYSVFDHVVTILSCGAKKTRVTYVIMWDEKLSSYSVLIMWSQYYHVWQNIIIGKNCYRVG
jgi:hypothetical protein